MPGTPRGRYLLSMGDGPQPKDAHALARLASHCRSLDPGAARARERLEIELGPELARLLLFALAPGAATERRAA
jgi:hypothetical protein